MPDQFRHQPIFVTAAVTFAAVVASAIVTQATLWWAGQEASLPPIVLASLIPAFLVPVMVYPLANTNQRLRRTRLELERIAHTDVLTGLPNRRAFFEQAERMLESRPPPKGSIAALMIDVDHFKAINDTYGHGAGDDVLRAVGTAIRDAVADAGPAEWTVARIGGEEFAVLTRGLEPNEMARLAERICHSARRLRHPAGFPSTVSVGVAFRIGQSSIDTLLRAADNAVYLAKQSGRDRWSIAAAERLPVRDRGPIAPRNRKEPPGLPAAQGIVLGGQDQSQ